MPAFDIGNWGRGFEERGGRIFWFFFWCLIVLFIIYIKENFLLDLQLKSVIQNNIQKYIDINSVRGFRHRSKLPVRGQRTHSNGKTRKRVN